MAEMQIRKVAEADLLDSYINNYLVGSYNKDEQRVYLIFWLIG